MQILLAAADRDLLRCYSQLLAQDGCTVETAFDGTQVYARLNTKRYDLLILSQALPRIPASQLLARCAQDGLPVILLLQQEPRLGLLLGSPLPHACLALPFLPEELRCTLRSVREKLASPRALLLCGLTIRVADFALGSRRLTARELDVLLALADGQRLDGEKDRLMISAINEKLAAQGLAQRIRYRKHDGYGMVTDNE